jgi:hypothetical protein
MGVAEVVGFAACWLIVATLMLWGVFTEKKRGPMRGEPPAGAVTGWHPSRAARTTPADWVVIEAAEGASQEITAQVHFLAGAWLASRGLDLAAVPPSDMRTEVSTDGDGHSTTRVMVRSSALQTSRRHR